MEQHALVLTHHNRSPNLALCDFLLFPFVKEKLAGRKITRIRDSEPRNSSNFRDKSCKHRLRPTIKVSLTLVADDSNCVCEAKEEYFEARWRL